MTAIRHSILQAIAGVAGRVAEAHRRRQTSRILSSLPDHVRKDIGYTARDMGTPRIIGSTWPY